VNNPLLLVVVSFQYSYPHINVHVKVWRL